MRARSRLNILKKRNKYNMDVSSQGMFPQGMKMDKDLGNLVTKSGCIPWNLKDAPWEREEKAPLIDQVESPLTKFVPIHMNSYY